MYSTRRPRTYACLDHDAGRGVDPARRADCYDTLSRNDNRRHGRGFACFWTRKSKRIGRPPISTEIVELIVRMATENPRWSRRRIAQELAKVGFRIDKNTVARYMPKPKRSAS